MATFKEEMDAMTFQYSDEHLEHHGIKGQKHGERRWQNLDGSLTPEGRIHYGVGAPRKSSEKAKSSSSSASATKKFLDRFKKKDEPVKKKVVASSKVKTTTENQNGQKKVDEKPREEQKPAVREKQTKYHTYNELLKDADYMSDSDIKKAADRIEALNNIKAKAMNENTAKLKKMEKVLDVAIYGAKKANQIYSVVNQPLGRSLLKEWLDIELPNDPGTRKRDKGNNQNNDSNKDKNNKDDSNKDDKKK